MIIGKDQLVEKGLLLVRSGTPAIKAATDLIAKFCNQLDQATIDCLLVKGLATLLSGGMHRNREPESELIYQYDRSEVERIHKLIECPFKCHVTSYKKKCGCVSRIIKLSGKDQEKAIVKQRKANIKMQSRWEDMSNAGFSKIVDLVENFSKEQAKRILSGIILQAADNSMKSLFDFSKEDMAKWEANSANKEKAWADRKEWFAKANIELKANKAETIAELPEAIVCQLGSEASTVWGIA